LFYRFSILNIDNETSQVVIVFIIYKKQMIRIVFYTKYQSRDEKFPEPNGEGNLVSRLVFFPNTPPKHDISV
jgi:hypothetical protein